MKLSKGSFSFGLFKEKNKWINFSINNWVKINIWLGKEANLLPLALSDTKLTHKCGLVFRYSFKLTLTHSKTDLLCILLLWLQLQQSSRILTVTIVIVWTTSIRFTLSLSLSLTFFIRCTHCNCIPFDALSRSQCTYSLT